MKSKTQAKRYKYEYMYSIVPVQKDVVDQLVNHVTVD